MGSKSNGTHVDDLTVSDDNDNVIAREPCMSVAKAEQEPLRSDAGDAITVNVSERDTQCGVFNWRPSCLQPFATIWVFTATISAYNVFGGINSSYYTAVITQIEKRFGLSSAMTGFIKNIDNFGFMVSVIVVSHFCRYANKPRVFAVCAIINAIAIFLFGLPHFLFDNPNASTEFQQIPSYNQSSTNMLRYQMCDNLGSSNQTNQCQTDSDRPKDFHAGAMGLFVASELLQGMAVAPKYTMSITYMDDNVQDQTSSHFGVLFGIRALSPMLGFLLGYWTNGIYVDLTDPGIDEKDPRWVGAWWIGFILCSLGTVLWAIPLILFPSRMKEAPAVNDDENLLDKTKDLPKAIVRLAKNPVYVCVLLGGCFNMSLVGFSAFIPKYLEYQFGVTASMASIYTGVIGMFSWGVGPVISGCIMSKTHMKISAAMKYTCLIQLTAILCYTVSTFIKCPDSEWGDSFNLDQGLVGTPCTTECSCDPAHFNPVCGSDGLNYYSPCYAGCLYSGNSTSNQVFEGCSCLVPNSLGGEARATLGMCSKSCLSMYFYMILILTAGFATSMIIVPVMTTLLRCVDEKDKAMGLAFSFALTQLLGFPAPILYGRVIDSTCLVQQTSCNRQGACLYYNNDLFRVRYHSVCVGLKVGAVLMYGLAWYFNRKKDKLESGVPPLEFIPKDENGTSVVKSVENKGELSTSVLS